MQISKILSYSNVNSNLEKKNIEKYFVMNVMNYFLIVVHSRYILESNMFSMAFALSRRFSFELRHNLH